MDAIVFFLGGGFLFYFFLFAGFFFFKLQATVFFPALPIVKTSISMMQMRVMLEFASVDHMFERSWFFDGGTSSFQCLSKNQTF